VGFMAAVVIGSGLGWAVDGFVVVVAEGLFNVTPPAAVSTEPPASALHTARRNMGCR